MSISIKSFAAVGLFAAATLGPWQLAAQIQFEKELSFAQALEKAKKEQKYVFVDIYATWCGPCKWMDKNTFAQEEVGKFHNEKFVSLKLDGEKGEGIELAKKHQIPGYPTMLYFDANGEEVYRLVGARKPEDFIAEGQKAVDPKNHLGGLAKKFEAGERSEEFLKQYMMTLITAGQDEQLQQVSAAYWEKQPKEKWTSAENFELVKMTVADYNSPIFKAYLSQRDKLTHLDAKQLQGYIEMVQHHYIEQVAVSQDKTLLERAVADFRQNNGKNAEANIADLKHHFYMPDPKEGFKHTKLYAEKYCDDAFELNGIAWYYFENESDPKKLKAAVKWTDKALKMERAWFILDTKANLLHALGRNKEAKAVAQEAIDLAKKEGQDPKETEELLKKL